MITKWGRKWNGYWYKGWILQKNSLGNDAIEDLIDKSSTKFWKEVLYDMAWIGNLNIKSKPPEEGKLNDM